MRVSTSGYPRPPISRWIFCSFGHENNYKSERLYFAHDFDSWHIATVHRCVVFVTRCHESDGEVISLILLPSSPCMQMIRGIMLDEKWNESHSCNSRISFDRSDYQWILHDIPIFTSFNYPLQRIQWDSSIPCCVATTFFVLDFALHSRINWQFRTI